MWRLLILSLLFPIETFGGGYGGAWGSNRIGQTIYIGELELFVYKNSKNGKRSNDMVAEFKFSDECDFGDQLHEPPKYLDCRKGTASPLAGAYYDIRRSGKHANSCGKNPRVYFCVKGCSQRRVPLIFVEENYEC